MESMDATGQRHMPYELLKEITGGFSDERILGRGGYGVVYRGEDKNGQEIAVKRLHYLDLEDEVFRREFGNLSKLEHPNIVQLVGFCCEAEDVTTEHEGKHIIAQRRHRALCIEYMHNGSLEKHISDAHTGLGWQDRYKIIKGICEGLKYLHMGLRNPICHLDLKPDNILLDKEMVPKIADFGISRLVGEENTRRTKTNAGTLRYMPPEFITYKLTSKEYDIYSLGVIIIVIMVGLKGYSLISDMKPAEFIEHVHNEWRERLQALQGYTSFEVECQQVKKCIEIALKCRDEKKSRRPTIGFIVDQLSETEKLKNDAVSCAEEQRNGSYHKLSPFGLSLSSLRIGSLKRSPNIDTDANRGRSPERKLDHRWSTLPTEIPANDLKWITDDFSPERILGHSAVGTLYKGILPNGREISVKKPSENSPVEQCFQTEINTMLGIQHEHIVSLVSFCDEVREEVVEHNGGYVIVNLVEKFLCYEYLPMGTLEKYISGETSTIDWDTRFKIIKGICTGLHFLHMGLDGTLIHTDIGPKTIWLDDNWVPKIGEFGLSRLFGQEQTLTYTLNVVGQSGYMAPEYLYSGEISTMSDIYSLGILIIEITTGVKPGDRDDKSSRKFVDKVQKNWKTDNQITSKYPSLDANGLQEVKACIEIGLKCVEADRRKRPSIEEIVNKLNERREISTELLDVYPMWLRLPFKPNKLISCSLQLKNRTDDCVAVRLLSKRSKRYKMPLCGIVPPLSTYTLVVTTREQKKPPSNDDEFLTLQSSIVREGDLSLKNTDADSVAVEYGIFFKKAKETDADKVHELTLKIVCDPPGGATSGQQLQSEVQIISKNNFAQVLSVDVHPTKPWIMTSHHRGYIVIWDYNTQEMVRSFNITEEESVYSSKFIEREQWLVAGDREGTIYVYNYYVTEQPVRTVEEAHDSRITSLAVHPIDPFVLSSSDDQQIKLWDWEKDWKCIRIFEEHDNMVKQVNFNPIDTSSFASASLDHTIKIWTISSSESTMTLRDHPDGMLCAHNYTSDTRQFFITGSWDGTAQIWDLETERCIQTLKGHVNSVGTVYHHPELPILITGSHDGTVRLWNSTSYRLENVIGFNLGAVYAFGYIESLRRIVVGCHQGIAIMEINLP